MKVEITKLSPEEKYNLWEFCVAPTEVCDVHHRDVDTLHGIADILKLIFEFEGPCDEYTRISTLQTVLHSVPNINDIRQAKNYLGNKIRVFIKVNFVIS